MNLRIFFLRGMLLSVFALALFQMSFFPHTMFSAQVASSQTLGQIDMFAGIGRAGVRGDPREIIKNIINIVMGFLGALAVCVILFAGFKWMTAAGNKENMEKAAKMLRDGVIGLIIIFSTWTLAQFILYALKKSVTP